jgi:RND family efflux transporter MFP subunit
MGRVTAVNAREGDRVAAGAPLVTIDDRDLVARREQADAGIRSADAAHHEALLQATRLRALFADSAAPRAQLDAAEAGLVRAAQGLRAATAAAAELAAITDYATVRAPFAGVVVQRLVDVGALAAPGGPLVRLDDDSRLRVVANVAPAVAAGVRRGATLDMTIEGVATTGMVEGVVPAAGAALSAVQVIVDNREGRFASGSAAVVAIPGALRAARLVPAAAIVRSGDLTGVHVQGAEGATIRWVRLGARYGDAVEVLTGLATGDTVLVPTEPGA